MKPHWIHWWVIIFPTLNWQKMGALPEKPHFHTENTGPFPPDFKNRPGPSLSSELLVDSMGTWRPCNGRFTTWKPQKCHIHFPWKSSSRPHSVPCWIQGAPCVDDSGPSWQKHQQWLHGESRWTIGRSAREVLLCSVACASPPSCLRWHIALEACWPLQLQHHHSWTLVSICHLSKPIKHAHHMLPVQRKRTEEREGETQEERQAEREPNRERFCLCTLSQSQTETCVIAAKRRTLQTGFCRLSLSSL